MSEHSPLAVDTDTRTPVDVVVGVLINSDSKVLMTTRPTGKVYAGYWEFPGGKVEAGETLEAALRRELQEEIGITIESAHAWRDIVMSYEHAKVRLYFLKVFSWRGELAMLESQNYMWIKPSSLETMSCEGCTPVLPGALPVLEWLMNLEA